MNNLKWLLSDFDNSIHDGLDCDNCLYQGKSCANENKSIFDFDKELCKTGTYEWLMQEHVEKVPEQERDCDPSETIAKLTEERDEALNRLKDFECKYYGVMSGMKRLLETTALAEDMGL